MHDISPEVSDYIKKNHMIEENDSVLAAVSGGADSMTMLDVLDRIYGGSTVRIGVVHVNHGFRPEAVQEAEYVEGFCRERNIPFYLKEIKPGECEPTEEAARLFRYSLIEMTAEENGYVKIALAHNANDRAETLLFNMFRGTGIKGMTSIRPVRDRFIRPLLSVKRENIEAYLNERNISFCTDGTNLGDDYSRNRIRHHILPLSEEINANSIIHMNETADMMELAADFIDGHVKEAYDRYVKKEVEGVSVEVGDLSGLHSLVRSELIRKMIFDMTPHLKDITSDHILQITGLALRNSNAVICLPYGIRAYREYGRIHITNSDAILAEETFVDLKVLSDAENTEGVTVINGMKFTFRRIDIRQISGEVTTAYPTNKYTKWFDYDKIQESLCVRRRRGGDMITIDTEGHKKSLGRYMIGQKISPRLRDSIPVIADGNEIIWIPGYRDGCAHRISAETKNILEIKAEDQNGRTC